MTEHTVRYSVFTKPWRSPAPELAVFVRGLGFDGIEFPLRPGYQVEPENAEKGLPALANILAQHGLRIYSVAGPTDQRTIEACGAAGIPVIRTMARIEKDYAASVLRLQKEYEALVPALEASGVTIGVQNHCDRFVPDALGLAQLLEPFDPRHVAAVWDAGHEALQGSDVDFALDVVWPKLCMVNLKNAYRQRTNGPEAPAAQWKHYWTSGRHGLASWPKVIDELKARGYAGVACLTAEYSDQALVDALIAEDIAYARALFA